MSDPTAKLFSVFQCRVPGRHLKRRDGTASEHRVTQIAWVAVPLDAQWQLTEERPADVVQGFGIWPAENRADAIKQAQESRKTGRKGKD